ncbi:MAG: M48 family metalloprotease [Thermoanaerobaculia bacterium]
MRALVAHLTLASLLLAAAPLPAVEISDQDLYGKSLLAAREALEAYGRLDDPVQHERVLDIAYRLADASGFDDFPFTFYLIDMPVPNAFALPGGQIFVTRGILDLGLSDDMLAGLLGHEIGHVTQHHGMRMQKRATLLNVLSSALLVGVMVAASGSGGQVDPHDPYARETNKVQGAAATGMVVSELLLRGYSREFEDEADLEGQRMAAAAGFDPDGTRQLMAKMGAAIPQTKEYGYWNTHPFFDERVQAADARQGTFRIATRKPADDYRRSTQAVLLDYAEKSEESEVREFLETDALAVWPVGARAEQLRLARLHEERDALLDEPELSRDFGVLLADYRRHLDEVERLTPASDFIATLDGEITDLESKRQELYPRFVDTFEGGIYQTDFLETFVSNYPDTAETPRVALALGQFYSRLGRQADAVDHYLQAVAAAPGGEVAEKARRGLHTLAGRLEDLTALQRLAESDGDAELADLARTRLDELAPKYAQLANGAAYLDAYPEGPRADVVTERLHRLADNLYGEVVLYQAVGDSAKAVQGIQEILKYAPLSPAAQRLRNQMVLES